MTDENLIDWVHQAIKASGGQATVLQIAKYIWQHHESDLRKSEELFYKWQYRMRWAGQILQKRGLIKKSKLKNEGLWVLTKQA